MKKKIIPFIDQYEKRDRERKLREGTLIKEEDSFDEYIGESYCSEEASDLSVVSEDSELQESKDESIRDSMEEDDINEDEIERDNKVNALQVFNSASDFKTDDSAFRKKYEQYIQ